MIPLSEHTHWTQKVLLILHFVFVFLSLVGILEGVGLLLGAAGVGEASSGSFGSPSDGMGRT